MNDVFSDDIINESDPEWGEDNLENQVFENSSDSFSFSDDWGDIDWDDTIESEWDTFGTTNSEENTIKEDIYTLEGYGTICYLDEYLNSSSGLIELLEHSKNQDQFNYILGMSHSESHDTNLLDYLMKKNYDISNYLSIKVGYQIFQFEDLAYYLLEKANYDEIKLILSKIAFVNDKIANIIVARDDRVDIINSNYRFKDKLIAQKIIEYFQKNPEKIDFSIIELCDLDLDTTLIKQFLSLGYVIHPNSPNTIIKNNEIMKDEFLKTVKIDKPEILTNLDKKITDIKGAYGMLYCCDKKDFFNSMFVDVFGQQAFEQMIKYIVLSDYDINLSRINKGNLLIIKNMALA